MVESFHYIQDATEYNRCYDLHILPQVIIFLKHSKRVLCKILLPFLKYAFHLTITFHYCCTRLEFDIFPDFYRQNRGESKLTRDRDTCTGIFCHLAFSSWKNLNRFNTMFLQSFDKSFVLPILAMFTYVMMSKNRFMKKFYVNFP
jgi:hypothetical protein